IATNSKQSQKPCSSTKPWTARKLKRSLTTAGSSILHPPSVDHPVKNQRPKNRPSKLSPPTSPRLCPAPSAGHPRNSGSARSSRPLPSISGFFADILLRALGSEAEGYSQRHIFFASLALKSGISSPNSR